MAVHLGSYNTSSSRTFVRFGFTTHAQDGSSVDPDSSLEATDLSIFKATDGAAFSATPRLSTAGITVTTTFAGQTGLHTVTIDLTNNADAGFYATGCFYMVVLNPDETFDSILTIGIPAYFEIGQHVMAQLGDVAHGGTASVLTLSRAIVSSASTNTPGVIVTGNGTGAALQLQGGTSDAPGLSIAGGDEGPGVQVTGSDLGNCIELIAENGQCLVLSTDCNLPAVAITNTGDGVNITSGSIGLIIDAGNEGLVIAGNSNDSGNSPILINNAGPTTNGDYMVRWTGLSGDCIAQAGSGEFIFSIDGDLLGSVESIASGGITSSSFASSSINAAALATDAANEIGTAVWATAARTLTAATNITSTGGTIIVTSGRPEVYLGNVAHGGAASVLTLERAIIASATAAEPAVKLTGNTTGAGLEALGGASGPGLKINSSAGTGLHIESTAGTGIVIEAGTNGISITGNNGDDGYFPVRLGNLFTDDMVLLQGEPNEITLVVDDFLNLGLEVVSLGTVNFSYPSNVYVEVTDFGNIDGLEIHDRTIVFNRSGVLTYRTVISTSAEDPAIGYEPEFDTEVGDKVYIILPATNGSDIELDLDNLAVSLGLITTKLPSAPYLTGTENSDGSIDGLGSVSESESDICDCPTVEEITDGVMAVFEGTELYFPEETMTEMRTHFYGGKLFQTGSVNDPDPTIASFIGDSSLSDADNYYSTVRAVITFASGPLQGLSNTVTAYDGDTRTFEFATSWSQAPEDGDLFTIMGRIG